MKLKLDRVISLATLVAAVVAIVLVLNRPAPVSESQPATVVVEHSGSDQKIADPQSQPFQANTWSPLSSPAPAAGGQGVPTAAAVAANAKPAPAVGSDEMSSMVAKLLGGTSGGAAPRRIPTSAPPCRISKISRSPWKATSFTVAS